MALRVSGFPLVVFTAKGNVPFAAVPVIYPYVHFCAAVLTEKQSRQRVDFPVPVWSPDGGIFQNPLYVFKVGAVNNRLMHVFRNLPLASVYMVVSLVAEMLCGLEVDYIAAILLPCQNTGLYLKNEQIPTPTFYMKERGRGTCKSKTLNEENRYKWNKATLLCNHNLEKFPDEQNCECVTGGF